MDLTTLEGTDTVGKIVAICAKAVRPDPVDPSIPSVAAVCLYPQLVPVAVGAARGHRRARGERGRRVPGGARSARRPPARDRARSSELGADEVDIVLNRSLFLGGRYAQAFEELVAAREAAGAAHLKVILETGELGSATTACGRRRCSRWRPAPTSSRRRRARSATGATLPVGALHDGGRARLPPARPASRSGIKVAGGVRASKQAIQYLTILYETLGADWMTPDRFRIGASTLLNDVLMQIDKERTGRYQGRDYFTVDWGAMSDAIEPSVPWEYAPAPESTDVVTLEDSLRPVHQRGVRRAEDRGSVRDDQPGDGGAARPDRRGRSRGRRARRRGRPRRVATAGARSPVPSARSTSTGSRASSRSGRGSSPCSSR